MFSLKLYRKGPRGPKPLNFLKAPGLGLILSMAQGYTTVAVHGLHLELEIQERLPLRPRRLELHRCPHPSKRYVGSQKTLKKKDFGPRGF